MRRAPSAPPELPGYTFVRALGSGGFSDVYLYDQKLPRRRVAVKVLLTDELSSATRAAFVDEANLMAQLSAHPYIVTIFHADVASDDRPYFVMEYCSGPSLAESYKRGRIPVADALRTGVRLSSAIATAHAAGILHRDIKPANVLTNDYGWPALTDFGISSTVDDDLLPVHTGTLADALAEEESAGGTSVGMSVPWSPPEMFEDDPQPDIRSDVFSLAATLYTVLAGRTPFEVRGRPNGTLDLIGRIERGAISAIDRDDLPRSLVAVLQKGMATDRRERFPTAVDFARALQRVELELGYAPTSIDVPNLLVQEAERDEQDDDETRVRSVAVVDAQPVSAVPVVGAPPVAGAPPVPTALPPADPGVPADPDATVARAARRIDAQPEQEVQTLIRPRPRPRPAAAATTIADPPERPSDAEPAEPMSRANRIAIAVAGGIAALVVIAVIIGIAVSGTGAPAEPSPDATGGGGPAVLESVPQPTLAGAPVLDGTTVVFSVENPEPEPDDTFRFIVSNLPDQRADTTADGRISVPGFTGQRICIDVWVVRDSRQSPDPLQTCYPVAP